VRSVALGLWVRTGSRDETPAQAGVSHFLEHLLFKGTERYSSIEIAEVFDGMGASTNAATGKESTQLYARFLDTHTDEAFDLLSEMLLGPTFPDIDSERQVVLEEIAMYEDEPSDKVHDVLDEAVFGDHPLGRRILGEAEVISSIPVPDIGAYHRSHYTGDTIVVAAAGNVDHERIADLAREHVEPRVGHGGSNGALEAPEAIGARVCFQQKDTEQYHVCFGGPGIDRDDERRYALAILDSTFGGSTSSRLFREVREKRGLAYAVGSYTQQFADSGLVGIYVGTREDNVEEACQVIGDELRSLHDDGISDEEVARAKESVKGRMVLSSESTAARMSRIGKATLFGTELLSLDEMIARVDAVTAPDVAELAGEFYAPESLSAAAIACNEDRFRKALAPVSEQLAAA
jgi:predicted Zn-dependent peptidase